MVNIFLCMVGLPGSGKSTFFKKVWLPSINASGVSYTYLSSDEFIEARAREENTTYSDVFKNYIEAAGKHVDQSARDAFAANTQVVIWDQTNLSIKTRRRRLSFVPKHYIKFCYDFIAPTEEAHKQRLGNPDRAGKTIAWSVIEHMKKTYEPPTEVEGFDIVSQIKDSHHFHSFPGIPA